MIILIEGKIHYHGSRNQYMPNAHFSARYQCYVGAKEFKQLDGNSLERNINNRTDWAYRKNFCCWLIVHITHWLLYLTNISASMMLVIYAPWYYAYPLITCIFSPYLGGVHCMFQHLENRYRQRLGYRLIETDFIPVAWPELKQYIITLTNKLIRNR